MQNQGNWAESVNGTANQDNEYEFHAIMTHGFGSADFDRKWDKAVVRDEKLRTWAKRTFHTFLH